MNLSSETPQQNVPAAPQSGPVFREASPDEVDRVLALRNNIFPPISRQGWEREHPITASVAMDRGELVGAIPLALRRLRIRPGMEIQTAFENAVGTAAERRGQGIGHGMIAAARQFLRDRVDALCVYRSDETSAAYRFYVKTRHVDLAYVRTFARKGADVRIDPRVEIRTGVEAVIAAEAECRRLFAETYARHGGFQDRCEGFHRRAISGLIYECHPHEFSLFRTKDGDPAYLLAGIHLRQGEREVAVLEMAGAETGVARLLEAALAFAAGRGMRLRCEACDESPFAGLLTALGFAVSPRNMVVMGQILDPERTAAKVWCEVESLSAVRVIAWTPDGEWTLHRPGPTEERTLRLEMKRDTLDRLLFARATVSAAVETGLITLTGAKSGDLAALDAALPRAPWSYHEFEFI